MRSNTYCCPLSTTTLLSVQIRFCEKRSGIRKVPLTDVKARVWHWFTSRIIWFLKSSFQDAEGESQSFLLLVQNLRNSFSSSLFSWWVWGKELTHRCPSSFGPGQRRWNLSGPYFHWALLFLAFPPPPLQPSVSIKRATCWQGRWWGNGRRKKWNAEEAARALWFSRRNCGFPVLFFFCVTVAVRRCSLHFWRPSRWEIFFSSL